MENEDSILSTEVNDGMDFLTNAIKDLWSHVQQKDYLKMLSILPTIECFNPKEWIEHHPKLKHFEKPYPPGVTENSIHVLQFLQVMELYKNEVSKLNEMKSNVNQEEDEKVTIVHLKPYIQTLLYEFANSQSKQRVTIQALLPLFHKLIIEQESYDLVGLKDLLPMIFSIQHLNISFTGTLGSFAKKVDQYYPTEDKITIKNFHNWRDYVEFQQLMDEEYHKLCKEGRASIELLQMIEVTPQDEDYFLMYWFTVNRTNCIDIVKSLVFSSDYKTHVISIIVIDELLTLMHSIFDDMPSTRNIMMGFRMKDNYLYYTISNTDLYLNDKLQRVKLLMDSDVVENNLQNLNILKDHIVYLESEIAKLKAKIKK